MSDPPGIPICLGCLKPEHRERVIPKPLGHSPMDGPWRADGTKPPRVEKCSSCGGVTIAGLYFTSEPSVSSQ